MCLLKHFYSNSEETTPPNSKRLCPIIVDTDGEGK
jgi:hypothetical protein